MTVGYLFYVVGYLGCLFLRSCFMPSGNALNKMVNFCLMTYPSGLYSFSLLFFFFFFVQSCLLFSKKTHDFAFGAVTRLLWGQGWQGTH